MIMTAIHIGGEYGSEEIRCESLFYGKRNYYGGNNHYQSKAVTPNAKAASL